VNRPPRTRPQSPHQYLGEDLIGAMGRRRSGTRGGAASLASMVVSQEHASGSFRPAPGNAAGSGISPPRRELQRIPLPGKARTNCFLFAAAMHIRSRRDQASCSISAVCRNLLYSPEWHELGVDGAHSGCSRAACARCAPDIARFIRVEVRGDPATPLMPTRGLRATSAAASAQICAA